MYSNLSNYGKARKDASSPSNPSPLPWGYYHGRGGRDVAIFSRLVSKVTDSR